MDEESIVTIREELSDDFFSLAKEHLGAVRGLVERLDYNQLDTQLQLEKYERECQQQEVVERTTPITISDEEQPEEGATKDTDGPRLMATGEEPRAKTEAETIAEMEEKPLKEAGETIEATVAAEQPVDTGDRRDPDAEAEQQVPEESKAGEPVQQVPTRVEESEQPLHPDSDIAAGAEQQQNKVPLDPLEQSLLDILDEE